MPKIWFHKERNIYCCDLMVGNVRQRIYLSKRKRESEVMLNGILKKQAGEVDASEKSYDKNTGSISGSKNRIENKPSHSELTVEKLCDRFLEYYETNKARNTYLFYKMYLDQLKKVCGQKPAADITPFDVETLKRYYMKRNCTVNSINHAIRSVKTAYNWAMDFDLLNVNPIVRVKKLPNPRGRTRFLTEEEEVRLIAATKGNLRDMIVIYLRTGMRLSELTQMKWSEVDMARGVLTVFKSKTSNTVKHYKPRVIPMHPDVRKILERRRPTQGYIFQSRACKPYDKNSLRKIFDRVRKKANLPDIYIHCLRHTFASRLALRGVPLTVVAELLGHTDIQTTQMYAHLAPSDLQRAIDKLDNLPV